MEKEIANQIRWILEEDEHRLRFFNAPCNPITGEGSVMDYDREMVVINDFPIKVQWLPKPMLKNNFIKKLLKEKTISRFLVNVLKTDDTQSERLKVIEQFVRVRCRYDFAFWAAMYVYIKPKGGGEDILFRLWYPQRILVEKYEKRRLAGEPVRLVLLKARQWGGSTTTQLYMAWLQMMHEKGLNSLIVAHQGTASDEINDMFDRMIKQYPVSMLHELGEKYEENEPKFVGVGKSGNIHSVPQRKCKIKIGTAERPDSARGGDYNLVHCSEVALWKKTEGKTPQKIVKAACSGVLYRPYTMIVYESTANGTGNFFQTEYDDAKTGKSQFDALFIAWWQIPELYTSVNNDKKKFAKWLWDNRDNPNTSSNREASGKYLWYLFTLGASLDAIQWYILERAKYDNDEDMASEYPSDDVEAFVHSGARVFDRYKVEQFKKACRSPKYIGDIYGEGDEGKLALKNLKFKNDKQAQLWVWSLPEIDPDEIVKNRYLVSVDIGGRSNKADWSAITVFDRLFVMDGGVPSVVAQWYGHIDMDLLAWKAAQIAAFYDNALLVIESNTLETHDRERQVDGDQSSYILNLVKEVYDNLYARPQSDEEIQNHDPVRYGFHTNTATKPKVISNLVKVIREGLYVERDTRCLDEYLCYEKKPNGSYGAILGKHDDLLMSRGIGLLISMTEMDPPVIIPRHRSKRRINTKSISEATI